MTINFIHIPKNGGKTFKNIIKEKLKNKSPIKYNWHNTDVFNLKPSDKTLIIIRDPIDRFCSAVRYAIQKWSHDPHIKKLIKLGITEPNQFAKILSNKNHKFFIYIYREVGNINKNPQKIGNKILRLKWTYAPQYHWINNPKYVILFENFENESKLLFESLGYNINIPKKNQTKQKHSKLSKKSINFLKGLYKKDYEILEEYRKMSVNDRLNL